MGYYTDFEFEVILTGDKSDPNAADAIIKHFRQEYDDAEYCLDADGETNNSSKWYDALSDLREFSTNYPHTVFVLTGRGEGAGDIWVAYVMNGWSCKKGATITLPPLKEAMEAWGFESEHLHGDYTPKVTLRTPEGQETVMGRGALRTWEQELEWMALEGNA